MEHRIGRRKKVNAGVELWYGDVKLGDYRIFNIGAGGLFLSGEDADIHEGEIYNIKLACDDQVVINHGDLIAMVVHRCTDGFGLMWAGCNGSSISRLSHALTQAA